MDFEKALELVLRIGALLSATLIATGLALIFALHGSGNYTLEQIANPSANLNSSQFPPGRVLHGVAKLHGLDWLYMGLMALMATPMASVVLNIAKYVKEGNTLYVVIGAIVLFNLIFSIILLPAVAR